MNEFAVGFIFVGRVPIPIIQRLFTRKYFNLVSFSYLHYFFQGIS